MKLQWYHIKAELCNHVNVIQLLNIITYMYSVCISAYKCAMLMCIYNSVSQNDLHLHFISYTVGVSKK